MQEDFNNQIPPEDPLEQRVITQPQPTLSRRKRGVAPVVGMACEPGYKQIGDDCVCANVEFV